MARSWKNKIAKSSLMGASNSRTIADSETFGIGVSKWRLVDQELSDTIRSSALEEDKLIEFVELAIEDNAKTDENNHEVDISSNSETESDEPNSPNKDALSCQEIFTIILNALKRLKLANFIHKLSDTNAFSMRDVAVMDVLNAGQGKQDIMSWNDHSQRLEDTLKSYNLSPEPVLGDGDCLFHSVLLNLQNLTENSDSLRNHLGEIGLSDTSATKENIMQVRKLMVQEWLDRKSVV